MKDGRYSETSYVILLTSFFFFISLLFFLLSSNAFLPFLKVSNMCITAKQLIQGYFSALEPGGIHEVKN